MLLLYCSYETYSGVDATTKHVLREETNHFKAFWMEKLVSAQKRIVQQISHPFLLKANYLFTTAEPGTISSQSKGNLENVWWCDLLNKSILKVINCVYVYP